MLSNTLRQFVDIAPTTTQTKRTTAAFASAGAITEVALGADIRMATPRVTGRAANLKAVIALEARSTFGACVPKKRIIAELRTIGMVAAQIS